MVRGLVRTFSKRTVSNLSRFPFSLNLDESTSNSNKKVVLIFNNCFLISICHSIVSTLFALLLSCFNLLLSYIVEEKAQGTSSSLSSQHIFPVHLTNPDFIWFDLKVLSMLVSYYHDDTRKVVVEHLGSLEVIKVNAVSLDSVLCDFFNHNILVAS